MIGDLISVVVPFYNNEKDIQETIDSIINQTYESWEIVLVDDGSQDNSLDIVRRNAEKDSRIRYFCREKEPKGGSTCRNIGIDNANGQYLIFLDADDLLSPTCLENRWNAIHGTDYNFIVFPMSTFSESVENSKRLTKWGVRDYDYYYMTGAPIWQVTSPIYKTSFIRELHGFDEKFKRYQDVELGLRTIVYSKGNFKVIEHIESDCYYRMPLKGVSVTSDKYINSLESYKYFLSLINHLRKDGYFKNRFKYSLGIFGTYCQLIQMIDILKTRKDKVGSFDEYNQKDLRGDMFWFHRLLLFFLRLPLLPSKAHRYVALRCNQFCRLHFMK